MDDIANLIKSLESNTDQSHKQAMANIDNQRNIAHDKLATQANSAGVLYSNYAPTKQIQYDAETYMPNVGKQMQLYLTTKDKMLAQGRQMAQQFQKLNEAIIEANSDK